ncbi:MAG: ATP-binding protein [Bacteroidales bacterium]|nr:ATP-binding protein [Bacteroidales bacterium]
MKSRFLIFPLVLLITFLIAYLTLNHFSKKNKALIEQTKAIYLPGIEISIKLNNILFELQKTLQDVVASGDEGRIRKADSLALSFTMYCMRIEKNAEKTYFSTQLSASFNKYYNNARSVSIEMIDGDLSKKLTERIDVMRLQYNEIYILLKELEIKNKKLALLHFTHIEKNNNKSSNFNLLIVFTGFLVSLLISYFFSNAVARPLKDLNFELQAREEELKKLNKELLTTNNSLSNKNTELSLTLNKLKETQLQLIQSEKMASIGLLSAGIAHEINNPLNFIQGGILVLEEQLKNDSKEISESLKIPINGIKTGIERITNIVSSLGRFSRNVDTNMENCNIHEIIDNCLIMLHNLLKHRITIVKKYTTIPYVVTGNEGRLHQSFLNIVKNSIQAIDDKGQITIETSLDEEKKEVEIIITDTGKGIKKEHLSKITDAFFTTKDAGSGTGLGLAITYNIIKEHHGDINYFSEMNNGTQVIIYLPVQKKP